MAQGAALPLVLPSAIAYDTQGSLYVADAGGHVVREVSAAGVVRVVAGNGVQGFSGDGGPAIAAELDSPMGLAVDAAGDLFVADSHNQRVREVAAGTGVITTVAGTGAAGFAGDGGQAKAAVLDLPTALACDAAGDVFVADTGNHRVRKIAAGTGVITTVAGNGVEGFGGDGGAATAAMIDSPGGLAVDAAGNLYLADTHNGRVRVVSAATGATSMVASGGMALPRGLALDAAGNVVVADSANHRVRTISPVGVITTLAGEGTQTFAGDGGLAVAASLDSPRAVAVPPAGLVTLADSGNQRVRVVDGQAPPEIHTVPWTVGAAPVNVTATPNPVAILYGQTVPALSGTLTGVLPVDAGKVTAVFASGAGVLSPVGVYPISATLTGSAAGNYVLTVAPASVTIAKAPVVVTAMSSSGSVNVGSAVTISVAIASTTSGAPTGSVTLLDGTAVLGVVPLSAGGAVWTSSALAPGTHALSAAYGGDGNFLPGSSTVSTVVVRRDGAGLHARDDGYGLAVGPGGKCGDVQLLDRDAGRGDLEPDPAGRARRADGGDHVAQSGEHCAGRAGDVYVDDSDSVCGSESAAAEMGVAGVVGGAAHSGGCVATAAAGDARRAVVECCAGGGRVRRSGEYGGGTVPRSDVHDHGDGYRDRCNGKRDSALGECDAAGAVTVRLRGQACGAGRTARRRRKRRGPCGCRVRG